MYLQSFRNNSFTHTQVHTHVHKLIITTWQHYFSSYKNITIISLIIHYSITTNTCSRYPIRWHAYSITSKQKLVGRWRTLFSLETLIKLNNGILDTINVFIFRQRVNSINYNFDTQILECYNFLVYTVPICYPYLQM